jgi:hypothetical protein
VSKGKSATASWQERQAIAIVDSFKNLDGKDAILATRLVCTSWLEGCFETIVKVNIYLKEWLLLPRWNGYY